MDTVRKREKMTCAAVAFAMDRYEAAAAAAGLALRVTGEPFDEASAFRAFDEPGIKENSEYFAVLSRWNGFELAFDPKWGTAGFDYEWQSFKKAIADFDCAVDVGKDLEKDFVEDGYGGDSDVEIVKAFSGYFPAITMRESGIVGFEKSGVGGNKLYRRSDLAKVTWEFPSFAGFFNSLAAALERGVSLNPDNELDRLQSEERRYAEICREMFPDIEAWRDRVA